MQLSSGEIAYLKIIDRSAARAFLDRPTRQKTALGQLFKTSRHRRGAGAAVDMLNYGLVVNDKVRAVMRIGPAPFGNQPVKSAVGEALAPDCAYIMRLAGAGISSDDMEAFVNGCLTRCRQDLARRGHDRKYLLSLDDPKGWLVEGRSVFEAPAYAGAVYQKCGALSAGFSKTSRQPTRYVDPNGDIKSVYNGGRNIINSLPPGSRLVDAGPKRRFVFVLAPVGSLEYKAWRSVLPAWVVELEKDPTLGYVQPRLLVRRWVGLPTLNFR